MSNFAASLDPQVTACFSFSFQFPLLTSFLFNPEANFPVLSENVSRVCHGVMALIIWQEPCRPSSAFLAPLTEHTHPQLSSSPTLGRHPPLLVLITVTICTGEGGKIVQEQRKDKRIGSYCPCQGKIPHVLWGTGDVYNRAVADDE